MAQQFTKTELEAQTYDELIELYDEYVSDTLYARDVARAYIDKARSENDSTKMARGYQRLAFVAKTPVALKYLDTTISLSKNSEHKNFPASGYLFKSFYLYNFEQYEQSLQYAIEGYRYAKQKANIEQQLTALHQMNGVNELWGDYDTALETSKLTYSLLFENQDIPDFSSYYLSSLEGIGKCYVRLSKPDSAIYYFRKGIQEALKQQDSTTYYAFVSQAGTALYVKGEYRQAIDSLQKADIIREEYNNSYLPNFYYYLGSSYYSLGDRERGISYLKKIDSIYEARHVLYPELPRVYDKLIEYYNETGEEELQLQYLYKLVIALRLIDDKRIYIKEKTNNDYIIPNLVAEKEQLISELEQKNQTSAQNLWIAFGFLALSLGFIVYYFIRQRQYKRRFENLMASTNGEEEADLPEVKDIGISEEIINEVMKRLDSFEVGQGYLSREVSLNDMAKDLDTNSTYLSKIINIRKGKNFSQYINDLRIDYAVEALRTNKTFRKYTIKAIANECGFKSAESFSKCFYKKHGIYPSYYLKQLQQTT